MKISVVMPVFNAAAWLEETLETVRAQADDVGKQDVELIVVDDGSEDRSAELAREFLSRHGLEGRVMATARNQGPAEARNLGWRSASGEWIQFLDADDLLGAGKFRHQGAVAASTPDNVAVVYSPWRHYTLVRGNWGPHGPVVRSDVDDDPLPGMLADFDFGYVGPTLVRRTALTTVGGFSPGMHLGEDFDLMLRLAVAGFAFGSAPSTEPLFFYRETPDSLWRRVDTDVDAINRLLRAIRDAEAHLTSSPQDARQLPLPLRLALASRYAQRMGVLYDHDRTQFGRVIGWISELGLRAAPQGTHMPVRFAAAAAGLDRALTLKFAARGALEPLRRRRTA